MILACQNISKAFGTDEIIQHASFHIEEYEKAAIVGINGAGKTTLLRIIMGELEADSGEVILALLRRLQSRSYKNSHPAVQILSSDGYNCP